MKASVSRAAMVAVLFPAIAAAQDSDESAGFELEFEFEEMIVTGEKRERSVQDTQSGISLITEAQLQSTFTPNIEELLLRIPNVNDFGGDSGLVIRGIPQGGPTSGINDPTANLTFTVYLDDIPLTSLTQSLVGGFGAWDVGRIEIFKGPQSTIQGRNSLAGALFINSKDPTYEFTGDAQAVYGSFDTQQYSVAVGGPIIKDKVAFRVSYDHQESNGFVSSLTTGSDAAAANNADLVRAKLLIEPTEKLTIKLTGIYSDNFDARGQSPFLLDEFNATGDRVIDDFIDPQQSDESFHLGARIDYALGEAWTLSALTSFSDGDRNRVVDIGTIGPIPLVALDQTSGSESLTQEVRAVYDNGGRFNYIVGAFYANIDLDDNQILSSVFSPIGPVTGSDFEETENFAFFGEAEWKLSDKLSLVAGLRYDNERTSNVVVEVPALFPVPVPAPASNRFDALLPKGQIIYRWSDDLSTSFTYQRGYRAGGADTDPGVPGIFTFDAEFTNNFEVALRSQWFDRRLTVNVNSFFIDWNNQQVDALLTEADPELAAELLADGFDDIVGITTIPINAGSSRVFGVEAELAYRATDGLDFFASIGYQNTRFLDFEDFDGNDFQFAPPVSATVGANYEHPIGFFFNINAAFTGGRFSDNANLLVNRTDEFTTVNLRTGYNHEYFGVSFFANNLTDEDFNTLINTDFGFANGGTERIFGVRVTTGF